MPVIARASASETTRKPDASNGKVANEGERRGVSSAIATTSKSSGSLRSEAILPGACSWLMP